jgi:hypothetical protein
MFAPRSIPQQRIRIQNTERELKLVRHRRKIVLAAYSCASVELERGDLNRLLRATSEELLQLERRLAEVEHGGNSTQSAPCNLSRAE